MNDNEARMAEQIERVRQVADMAAVMAADMRSTPYERALAGRFDETIRAALDGPGDALLERIGRVLDAPKRASGGPITGKRPITGLPEGGRECVVPGATIRVAKDLTIQCQWGADCPNVATTWRLSTASPMPKRMAVLNETTGAWCYPVCESHQVPMETPPAAITAGIDRWAAHLREVLRKSLGIAPPRDPWNEEA